MPKVQKQKHPQLRSKPTTDLFTVRDILDYKNVDGIDYYLVWWDGFTKQESTWEPLENIKAAEEHGWDEALAECKRKAFNREKYTTLRARGMREINGTKESLRKQPRRRTPEEIAKTN